MTSPRQNEAHLDPALLENVHSSNGKTVARCPACAESGADKSGDHLTIDAQGRFGCAVHPGVDGAEQRRRLGRGRQRQQHR